MKNKLILFIICLVALVLVGCQDMPGQQGGENPINPGVGETEDLDAKFEEITNYVKENTPYFVHDDIELITYYEKYNTTIEWSSSNENVIDFTGAVKPNISKALEVTMSFIMFIGDEYREDSLNVIVSKATPEDVMVRFERQFSSIITRDYDVEDTFYDLYEIEWTSSNEEVFDNQGCYHKPIEDTEFMINYVLKCKDYESEQQSITLTAVGLSDLEKLEEAEKWLKTEVLLDLYLTENVVLPTKYDKYNITVRWECTNPDVISADGKITSYVFERYVTLLAHFELENGSVGTTKFECIVAPLDTTNMSKAEILENFLSAIALTYYGGVKFNGNGTPCNKSYGHLNFYVNEQSEIDVDLIPVIHKNRTQIPQQVKLIVCHDTGNNGATATAAANANYVRSGYGGSSTGWHYTVGNDGVFQTVPDNEVAYQANGSSNQYTTYIKTNVKATWRKPNFTVSDDGFIMINNQKTNIELPNKNRPLATDGPVWKIGSDGYYYIAKLWYCESHNYNATQGGNANAIGIESAVNSGSDYALTCRIFAKLVAELVMKHNLDLGCVVQHNTTSGKDCPSAMRATNYWYTFKDMIAIEMFAKQNFPDYEFVWTGHGDIDNTGKILLNTEAKEVKYSVVVSKDSTVILSKEYTTKIN